VAVLLLFAMPAANAATLTKVMDDPDVDESSVAVSVDYFAWSQNSASHPRHYNTYVRPAGGGDAVRVNPRRTNSYNVGIDGSTVVYQRSRRGDGDLALYDAATQARPSLPDGVNTDWFENRPSLSGDWLLFTRQHGHAAKVVLFNLSTSEQRILRTVRDRHGIYLVSDQVNGDWATFESCGVAHDLLKNCNLFRYQISTEETTRIPPDRQQYSGGIDTDATVYMTRTGGREFWECGRHSRILRSSLGGGETVLVTLRRRHDAYVTFAVDETDGSTTAYVIKVRCSDQSEGIYSITDADTTT
jgi:hypothetical protein